MSNISKGNRKTKYENTVSEWHIDIEENTIVLENR